MQYYYLLMMITMIVIPRNALDKFRTLNGAYADRGNYLQFYDG